MNEITVNAVLNIIQWGTILAGNMFLPALRPWKAIINWEAYSPGMGVIQIVLTILCVVNIVYSVYLLKTYED